MYTELKTALAMWCEDPFPGWGGGRQCYIIVAVISILITRNYFCFFLFFKTR